MSAGTIKLTNGSTAIVGTSTTFITDLKSGDVISITTGGVPYTLFVDTVTSNTALTLSDAFTGPTTSGAAYVAVPAQTLSRLPAQLVSQTAEAVRRVLQDNANWQGFYSGSGDITVTVPDGTPAGKQMSGPSWAKISGVANSAWIDRGSIGSSDNINTYSPATSEGEWYKSTSTGLSAANGFPVGAGVGVLKVVAGGRFNGTQIYTAFEGNTWVRGLSAAWNGTDGPWGEWYNTATRSLRSTLVTGSATDLNTYTSVDQYGTYRVAGSTNSTAALGWPYDNFAGTVEVVQGYGSGAQQIALSNLGNMFSRYWNGGTNWSTWLEIGCQVRTGFVSGDLNTVLDPGLYSISYSASTSVNFPGNIGGVMRVINRGNSAATVVQEFISVVGSGTFAGRKFFRTLAGGTWTAWSEDGIYPLQAWGIGATAAKSSLDWQNDDLIPGAMFGVLGSAITNTPSQISINTTTVYNFRVVGGSGSGATTNRIVEISPQTTSDAVYQRFEVRVVGATGSRTFNVRQLWTSADTVPIVSGGTGASTQAAARTSLDVFATGDIGPEFINGLDLSVDSAGGTITCGIGSAYIPANGIVRITSPVTVVPTGLVAATWRHVYLYMNGSTPAIEAVATEPVDYAYPAKQKTGANTRRYLGSFRVGSTLTLSRQICINGRCYFTESFATSYRIVSNGMSTVKTNAITNIAAPTTATMLELHVTNSSTGSATPVEISSKPGAIMGGATIQPNGKMALQVPNDGYPYVVYQFLANAPSPNGVFIDVGGYSYAR